MSREAIEFLIKRFDVNLQMERPIRSLSALTIFPGMKPILSVRDGLEDAERIEAIAVQLGHLALGTAGKRKLWINEREDRRDWKRAFRWAARLLISDEDMDRADRREYDPFELADELGVTVRLVLVRAEEWFRQRGQVLPFDTYRLMDVRKSQAAKGK